MAKLFSAQKVPRRPHFKKRANATANHERVINKIIHKMPDSSVKRIRQGEAEQKALKLSVERKMVQTRATKKYLQDNQNIIEDIAKEHFDERKYFIYELYY